MGVGMQPGGVDGHFKLAEEHATELEGGVQFADPIEEQPEGIGAGHVEPLGVVAPGPDLGEFAGDNLEQTAGGLGHQQIQRRRGRPQPQVGGVFEDLVHAGIPSAEARFPERLSLCGGRESYEVSPVRIR